MEQEGPEDNPEDGSARDDQTASWIPASVIRHLFFGSSRNLGQSFLIIPVRSVHAEAVKVGRVAEVEQSFGHAEEEEAEVEVGQEALGHNSINGHDFDANKCL